MEIYITQVLGYQKLANAESGKHPNRVTKAYVKAPTVKIGGT